MDELNEDDRIFEGKRDIHISKGRKYTPNSMYVVWQKNESEEILGNIVITNSLMVLVMDRFKKNLLKSGSETPDFDDILLETTVDTLNHELMHLAICDTEGVYASKLYDLFIGGTLTNDKGFVSSGGCSIQYRREIKYKEYLP